MTAGSDMDEDMDDRDRGGDQQPETSPHLEPEILSAAMVQLAAALEASRRVALDPRRDCSGDIETALGGLTALGPLAPVLGLVAGRARAAAARGVPEAEVTPEEAVAAFARPESLVHGDDWDARAREASRLSRAAWAALWPLLRILVPGGMVDELEKALAALDKAEVILPLVPAEGDGSRGSRFRYDALASTFALEVERLQLMEGVSQSRALWRASGVSNPQNPIRGPNVASIDFSGATLSWKNARDLRDDGLRTAGSARPLMVSAAKKTAAGLPMTGDEQALLDEHHAAVEQLNVTLRDDATGREFTVAAHLWLKASSRAMGVDSRRALPDARRYGRG